MDDPTPKPATPSAAETAPGSPGAVATMNGEAQMRAEHAAEQFRAPLARYAAHLLGGDHGLGQDVAQDCFEKLLRKPPAGLNEMTDGRLKAWLYTVCRNRALDLRRKDRRMTAMPTPSFDQRLTPAQGPADQAQQHDMLAAVLRRIAALPTNQQEVIRLRFQGGLSYPEIAEVTGLTRSNVGYLLHHGLKTLRSQLDTTSD